MDDSDLTIDQLTSLKEYLPQYDEMKILKNYLSKPFMHVYNI